MGSNKVDELVESYDLYQIRKLFFHGYNFPFLLLYLFWLYWWCVKMDFWEFTEGGSVGISIIACFQLLSYLACQWSVHICCLLTCKKEKDPLKATVVKVVPTSNNGSSELVKLHHTKGHKEMDHNIWFVFQKTKYVWFSDKKTFNCLEFPIDKTFREYFEWKGYQEESDIYEIEQLYGKNYLDIVIPEFKELFKERAIAPFFVFQVFCVALWCLDKYWYYSIFTLIMLILFECTLVQQQLRNMSEILKMGNKPYNLSVYRNRRWRNIFSDQIIPGDLVSITRSQNDNLVPCDLLLIRGHCIVDESLLTGESVPQMKEPVDNLDSTKLLNPESDGKLHVLFGGTKVVQQSPPAKSTSGLRANDNGCVCYVLRTGFNTAQGKLLRTILFGVKRVTANNLETFGFILFLLVFAIAAAAYVWIKGCEDPDRSRYRLFLECTLIITSVIPPELPIELSLAVNTSLLSLSKLGVFCTEPFRIPFAGKVEICCFDKTGTLTSDRLIVEGVALTGASGGKNNSNDIKQIGSIPIESTHVLATCHSLVNLGDELVGDPLEKATLTAIDWNLTKAEVVIPKKGKSAPLKIFQRFHFSSALKRMSVVAGYNQPGSSETSYLATVKGAPETIKNMLVEVPESYDRVYSEYSRSGARVLALAWKNLENIGVQELRKLTREQVEEDVIFAGFLITSCPMKSDSKNVIKEMINSSHKVIMITGDNPLTACHVAKELNFTSKSILILDESKRRWKSVDETVFLPLDTELKEVVKNYSLCITGDAFQYLKDNETKRILLDVVAYATVFARFAPKQKEQVILTLKSLGYITLMCGDGTNDVGALKHADVGVAILANAPEKIASSPHNNNRRQQQREQREREREQQRGNRLTTEGQNFTDVQTNLQKIMKEIEEQDKSQLVKLGDASIASPFTSKLSSVACVCHVVKQGRCTLVTTLQMFKILALNALILAYTQSILYLDGIKLRDMQATLQGVLLASCFLFISRSKPLRTLSKQRPLPNIFNFYTILTVLLQFSVHFVSLIFIVREAKSYLSPEENVTPTKIKLYLDESEEDEKAFVPNIVNSAVYIISMSLQLATFTINYRGYPFMESFLENKALLYSIVGSFVVVLSLALGVVPDLSAHFELIQFPDNFRIVLVQVIFADFFFSYLFDRICLWLCGEGKMKKELITR